MNVSLQWAGKIIRGCLIKYFKDTLKANFTEGNLSSNSFALLAPKKSTVWRSTGLSCRWAKNPGKVKKTAASWLTLVVPLEIVEQKAFIRYRSVLLFANLSCLLIHCWSGTIVLKSRWWIGLKSPLHHPPTSSTLLLLHDVVPAHKNWFILTMPENKHLLTIPISHFSHTFSLTWYLRRETQQIPQIVPLRELWHMSRSSPCPYWASLPRAGRSAGHCPWSKPRQSAVGAHSGDCCGSSRVRYVPRQTKENTGKESQKIQGVARVGWYLNKIHKNLALTLKGRILLLYA